MKQVNLNEWKIDVDEKDYKNSKGDVKTVYMYFGGKAISVHLYADGSSTVGVNSHNCSGDHAKVSKNTRHLKTDGKLSGFPSRNFTCKETEIESHDTRVSLRKFSRI